MRTLTPQMLADAARLSDESVRLWVGPLNAAAALSNVDTPLRWALWLAICGHESAGFSRLSESFNYSPQGLRTQWKAYRTETGGLLADLHGRSGNKPADQEAIANFTYNGRLGNRPGSSDGWDFRGSGIGHITGRDMFGAAGDHVELDFIGDPGRVRSDRRVAALSAVYPWVSKRMNDYADAQDVAAATAAWTGGSNPDTTGLAERSRRYNLALSVIAHGRGPALLRNTQ